MTKTSKKSPTAASSDLTSSNDDASPFESTPASKIQATEPGVLPKPASKQQQLASLLVRDGGATLGQMVVATGWLPHTTRAALTGLRKKGYAISSDKLDGVRTYRGIAPE